MKLFLASLLGCSLLLSSSSAGDARRLNLEEVLSLVRTNLTDLAPEDLSNAAALGLIKELGTKVQLVTNNPAGSETADEVLGRRSTYNGNVAYVQIRRVDERLPEEVQKWLDSSTNGMRGMVLDLRFASGDDYTAAAQVGQRFFAPGQLVLKLGTNEVHAAQDSKPLDTPVAVLAGRETRGAAEALAALVREAGAGLVIGTPTAGEARLFETFTLSTGQKLKIGTVPVLVGEKAISAKGLAPDISVSVGTQAERIFYQDPFRSISPATGQAIVGAAGATNEVAAVSTNRSRRFNEAELVRRHRAGTNLDEMVSAAPEQPDQPVINDPVLARALDFLKGISALQQHRPL